MLSEINENYPDIDIINKTLEIISEKSWIQPSDKNSADLNQKEKKLSAEIKAFEGLKIQKSTILKNLEKKSNEINVKKRAAESELENMIKEINRAKYSESNYNNNEQKYHQISNEFGISVENKTNSFEVTSNTAKIVFELFSSQKYKIRSNTLNFIYKDTQNIYASELSYFFYRLLINNKEISADS